MTRILIFAFLFALQNTLWAATYTTIKGGNWNDNSIWAGGSAPSFTPVDTIIINHVVNYGNNQVTVYEYLEVTATGKLTTNKTKALRLHQFSMLVNYGSVEVPNLIIDGTVHNYNSFFSESFTNSAIGVIYNHTDAFFESDEQVSNSGTIINDGVFSSSHIFVNNQGLLTGNGGQYIFDHNLINNAGATIEANGPDGIDLCSTGGQEPSNLVNSSGYIDSSNVTICGRALSVVSLPITLVSFTATEQDGKVVLEWVTQIEIENDYFEVERSYNGIDFEVVAVVDGAGNSSITQSYNTIDNPEGGQAVYYRLKQTDFDGTFTYSDLVAVQPQNTITDLSVSPNPTTGTFTLKLIGTVDASIEITLYNSIGQAVMIEKLDTEAGLVVSHTFDLQNDVPAGTYYLSINTGKQQTVKQLIVE